MTIEIVMDSAVFEGYKCGSELARILRNLAIRAERLGHSEMAGFTRSIFDENGNKCGHAEVQS